MLTVFTDIRYACRTLIAQPGWTLAAVLCLGIGAGANTASFSIINGVLLRPLPFAEPHQLMVVAAREPGRSGPRPFALAEFRDMEASTGSIGTFAARTFLPSSLSADGPARMVQTELVSGRYFEMLGLHPLAGRWLSGTAPEAVVSESLWRSRFHSDRSIVGRLIRVNGRPVTVCGVAPAGFAGAMQLIKADLWLPAFGFTPVPDETPMYGVMARLNPGVTPGQAGEQLGAILANRARTLGQRQALAAIVEPARGFGVPPAVRSAAAGGSALLFGLMGLIVAVAIANVAGLMLARSTGRRREVSLRLALGASPSRIVRQVLTESLVLAAIGAVLGVLFAVWLPHVLTGLGPQLPEHLSFGIDIRPDWRVVAYASITAVFIAGFFGLAPARQVARIELVDALKQSGGNRRTPETSRVLNAFVIGQVAIATILLVAAGLLARTYLNTQRVDPGIDTRNALAVSLDLNQSGYDAAAGRAAYGMLLSRVGTLPGVTVAALMSQPPLSAGSSPTDVWVDGPAKAGAMVITPEYFEMLRIPLLHGRNFTAQDRGAPTVAIVNETMAQRFWPGSSPLGRTFRTGGMTGRELEVIGVAKDIKYRKLSESAYPAFYQPLAQAYAPQMTIVARTMGDPRLLIEPIRREIQAQSGDLAAVDVRTLEDQLRESMSQTKQSALILAIVCLTGLVLSSVGLFGVMSYGVRERTREFGVRMALGARSENVMAMVLRQGLRLVLIGLGIGIPAALALTRILQRVLFGVTPSDPMTLGIVACVLVAVALAASYLPARWATRVDPMIALRSE